MLARFKYLHLSSEEADATGASRCSSPAFQHEYESKGMLRLKCCPDFIGEAISGSRVSSREKCDL